jgi:hypothetical protein
MMLGAKKEPSDAESSPGESELLLFPSAMPDHGEIPPPIAAVFEDRPTVKNASLVGLQGGGVGVLVASVQNALDHHNRGAMGVLTRSGGTIGFFG